MKAMKITHAALLLGTCIVLCAQSSAVSSPARESQRNYDERLAVIETRLDQLKSIDDRINRLNDKIDALTLQLQVVNTKISIAQWLLVAIGGLALTTLWNLVTKKKEIETSIPTPRSKEEFDAYMEYLSVRYAAPDDFRFKIARPTRTPGEAAPESPEQGPPPYRR